MASSAGFGALLGWFALLVGCCTFAHTRIRHVLCRYVCARYYCGNLSTGAARFAQRNARYQAIDGSIDGGDFGRVDSGCSDILCSAQEAISGEFGMTLQNFMLAILIVLLVGSNPYAEAQQPIVGRPDVRILIDISGSMKQSDPTNLRAPALELIVQLLPPGSKAGVWLFGDGVKTLMPHMVIDEAWRKRAIESVRAIDNSGQRTNIPAAVDAALYDIDRLDPDFRTSIVLLTDGKVDVSSSAIANSNAARQMLEQQAPLLGETGVPVHTIALSNDADWAFLRRLAEVTRGLAEKAETADLLTRVFLQALEMVAPTARVPIQGGEFLIDDGVSQFTALIFSEGEERAEVALVSPTLETLAPQDNDPSIRWFTNEKFSLVTVYSPMSGRWRLVAPSSDQNMITVISNLSIDVDPLPNSIPLDQPAELGLRLVDSEGIIRDPALLSVFEVVIDLAGPGGFSEVIDVSERYPSPPSGEYRIAIPAFNVPGVHVITARVSAGELVRELPMYVDVQVPAQAPKVVTKAVEPSAQTGLPEWLIPSVAVLLSLSLLLWVVSYLREKRKNRRVVEARRSQEDKDKPLGDMSMRTSDDR